MSLERDNSIIEFMINVIEYAICEIAYHNRWFPGK